MGDIKTKTKRQDRQLHHGTSILKWGGGREAEGGGQDNAFFSVYVWRWVDGLCRVCW